MDKLFQVPATIEKVETLEDRSLKIKVITQELTSEQNANLFQLNQKIGWFCFAEQEMKEIKIPEMDTEFQDKPDYVRLSNVWWRILEQKFGRKPTDKEFRDFYHSEYARLIEKYKEKLI